MPNANGRSAARCRGELGSADSLVLDYAHPALRAQAAIRHALETGTAAFGVYGQSPVTLAELIADFAAIGGRVLAYASPTELSALLPADIVGNYVEGLEVPADEKSARVTAESPVSATALAAAAAWSTLAPPTTRGAAERLRWLIESNRKRGFAVRASSVGWGRGVSAVVRGVQLAALEPFLVPSDQLRYRIAGDVPTAPFDNPLVNRLPALAWMRWSLPLRCAGVGYSEFRAALSAAIALVGTRAHLTDITADLGATTTVRGVLRVLQRLHSSSRWPETRSTLNAYANYLCKNPPPIDYRRRRSLSCSSLLPDKKWADLCLRLGIDAGRGPRLRLVRSWLFERLTTLPADRSPWSTDSAAFRSSLSAMALWMTAELVESLDQHALEFLQDRGIHGEPVVWRPPTDAAAQGGLPGLEVESLHRWIGAQKPRSFAKLSEQFGFDADVARAVLDERPVASHWFGPATESISTAAGARVPTRRQFEILYTERRWGLARIASHTGLSRRSVTELAYLHGISIRPPGRPTRLKEN